MTDDPDVDTFIQQARTGGASDRKLRLFACGRSAGYRRRLESPAGDTPCNGLGARLVGAGGTGRDLARRTPLWRLWCGGSLRISDRPSMRKSNKE